MEMTFSTICSIIILKYCARLSTKKEIVLYHIEYDNYLPESIVDLEFQYHNLEKYINNMMNI